MKNPLTTPGPSRSLYVFAGWAALLVATTTGAADWPQWRGPDRNGLVEKSPALNPTFAGQSPTWQSEPIPGGDRGGRGSLVVHAGRVYGLTCVSSESAANDEVFCLDALSGKTLWKTRLREPGIAETGSSTPCIVNGRLYVAGSGSRVYCLNAESGRPVWEAQLPRSFKKSIASSVAVVNGVVVLLAEVLTGLDAETGQVLWTQKKISGHESSPARWHASGKEYLICNTKEETHGVDPARGDLLWSVPGGGKSTPVVAQEYGGDFLVNMSESRKSGLSAYRLTPDGPKKLWTLGVTDRGSSPVVFDGHVYAIAGGGAGHGAHILCVHLDTGKVAWDEVIDFAEVSSPVIADGKVFAVCGTFLWLLQATPEKYTVLGQADCRITLCTSPSVGAGRLYLRQGNAVACYDLRSAP
jgi:outer membrane protein assembly factor BamB